MQAVGQMINDDWCFGASHEWEHGADDADWRYSGMPDGDTFAVLSDEEPIDIEGTNFHLLKLMAFHSNACHVYIAIGTIC